MTLAFPIVVADNPHEIQFDRVFLYAVDTLHDVITCDCPHCCSSREGHHGPLIGFDEPAIEFGGNDGEV